MKKLNLLIAAGILALSLAGCSNGTSANSEAVVNNTTAVTSTSAESTAVSEAAETEYRCIRSGRNRGKHHNNRNRRGNRILCSCTDRGRAFVRLL